MSPAKRDIGLDFCADNFQRLDGANSDTDTATGWNCTNSIAEGDVVEVVGLQRQRDLNGKTGSGDGWDFQSGRFKIRIVKPREKSELKLIKAANLQIAE